MLAVPLDEIPLWQKQTERIRRAIKRQQDPG
jgi:hypothetical protein